MPDGSILLLLCLFPVAGALAVVALPKGNSGLPRIPAMLAMLGVLLLAGNLVASYGGTNPGGAFDLDLSWIPALGVDFHLAVDGLNIYLLLLTGILFPVVLGCCWQTPMTKNRLFLVLILLLQSGLLGTFLAQNLMLFFICWEAVLIPMFILILAFGGERSRPAAQAFFLYTMAGSVLLLAAVILLGVECRQQTGAWSFELDTLLGLNLAWGTQLFVFCAVTLACAIKCPLFPFHSWLPLAYAEAPPAGTALMAGALSKMGAFGLLKLALPLCPLAASVLAPWMLLLAVVSILYGAVLALRQEDFRKLVAYSSLSHMGYVVLGIFSLSSPALHGALLQMLSHGVAVAGLFLLLGLLEERSCDSWRKAWALGESAPRLAVVLMLFILTSIALPLTSGFTAEFLILFGSFQQGLATWLGGAGMLPLAAAILASTGMVLGAGYMLRFARIILFGSAAESQEMRDLGFREAFVLAPLLLLILWVGIRPAPFMDRAEAAVTAVTARAAGEFAAPPLITDANGGYHGQ